MGNKRKFNKTFNLPPGSKGQERKSSRLHHTDDNTCETNEPGAAWYDVSAIDSEGMKLSFKKCEPTINNSEEFRIVNLGQLGVHVSDITLHSITCQKAQHLAANGTSPIQLLGVKEDLGLACILQSVCKGCLKKFSIRSSPLVSVPGGSSHFEINVRGVWGEAASGGGGTKLNEVIASMGMPGMSGKTFTKIEDEIGQWWGSTLKAEMLAAGIEEREIALKKGIKDEDVPAITVVLDGGWSKRSHKHTYNASGGVAIIVGAETGKLLYLGIRNKQCLICTKALGAGLPPPVHRCGKNWERSSQAMEADIILQGFQECESEHGVRYMTIIGDGDSSVLATLRDKGPPWCRRLQKLECANHVCKNVRAKLEKLVQDKTLYKGTQKLPKNMRVRITTAVRCAIRMRSDEASHVDSKTKVSIIKKLQHDIKNSVWHVYGHHGNCSKDFCKAKEEDPNAQDPYVSFVSQNDLEEQHQNEDGNEKEEDEGDDVMLAQWRYWVEGTSPEEMESIQSHPISQPIPLEKQIIDDVSKILQAVAEKADQLLGNFTTNLAESWMGIRTKFDGGKMVNRCQRTSWHTRCYGAGLRRNLGPCWSPKAWEICTTLPATKPFHKFYEKLGGKAEAAKRSRCKPDVKARALKRKYAQQKTATSKAAKRCYGEEALQPKDDISPQELERKGEQYFETEVKLSHNQRQTLARRTVQQSMCKEWHDERKKRITASVVGQIVRRNPSIKVCPLVRRMLYSSFQGTVATRHGMKEEEPTLREYEAHHNNKHPNNQIRVEKTGLHVHPKKPWLAASPDGLVVEGGQIVGVVEVKNPLFRDAMTLHEASKRRANFCLVADNGTLKLKEGHDYWWQCLMLMEVLHLPWCDFVLRTERPHQMHIERLLRQQQIWQGVEAKVEAFYRKALLPELAVPREGLYPGIREPGLWVGDTYICMDNALWSNIHKFPQHYLIGHSANRGLIHLHRLLPLGNTFRSIIHMVQQIYLMKHNASQSFLSPAQTMNTLRSIIHKFPQLCLIVGGLHICLDNG